MFKYFGSPMIIRHLFFVLIVLASPERSYTQIFTKITDVSNPVVNDQFESGGGTWFDVNNDGYLDLFVANGNLSIVNNSLYINMKNGNFKKVFSGAVVTDGGSSIGGTVGDYNADGKPDLFVTNRQNFGNFLYKGTGDSVFTKVTTGNPVTDIANSNSSSWIDIDNDGDLDLFTINFQENNFLYYNSGAPDFTFTRVDTGATVFDGSNFSIPGLWGDYNNDRKPDLYIGNAGNQNDALYTNHGNGYLTATTFMDGRSTLGGSWGDYDNDGDLDLFVANFLNQNNFLYNNNGAPNYSFTRIDTGIVSNDGGQSVGSSWGDFDNDGDLDLFIANDGQNNALYLNSGYPNYAFTKVTTDISVNDGGNSFGCVAADYDNNGSLDLFVANRLDQKNFLYSNNGNSNAWSTISLKGTSTNRSAIGTKLRMKATINGVSYWQMQEVTAQTGYNSQNLRLHFGLGNATVIDSVRIDWQSGVTEYFANQPVNKNMTFVEGSGPTQVKETNLRSPVGFQLFQNYPNPFNPGTVIRYQIPEQSFVSLKLYDALGREMAELVSKVQGSGEYSVELNSNEHALSSGMYYYRITSGSFADVKKLIILK